MKVNRYISLCCDVGQQQKQRVIGFDNAMEVSKAFLFHDEQAQMLGRQLAQADGTRGQNHFSTLSKLSLDLWRHLVRGRLKNHEIE